MRMRPPLEDRLALTATPPAPPQPVAGPARTPLALMAQRLPPQTLVLPSHGLPFTGVQPRVEALQAHHEERLHALEDSCEQAPQSAAELLDVLFNRPLDTHQTMFAMGEAIAHLNYLEQAGRLSRHCDAEGVIRYSRTGH